MNKGLTAALTALTIGFLTSTAHAVSVYDFSFGVGAGSVVGTLETDGTLGALGEANVLDWNLLVDDGSDSFSITPANTSFNIIDPVDFFSTSEGLFFDFSSGDGQWWFSGLFGSPETFEFVLQPGFDSAQIAHTIPFPDFVITHFVSQSYTGLQQLGTFRPVPAPAAIVLLGSGLLAMAMVRRPGRPRNRED